jgi:hypothetical protein
VAIKTTTSENTQASPFGDIRSACRASTGALVRQEARQYRLLVFLDLVGLTLGVYGALAFRAVYYDESERLRPHRSALPPAS